jgi:predicted HicB family RNase H-like nuclease
MHDSKILSVELPPSLHSAVKAAAEKDFISISAYIRRAVAVQVRADGFDPYEGQQEEECAE